MQAALINDPFIFDTFPNPGSYHAAWPPSILRSAPVIKEDASLIRNTAAPRYSSGLLNFPSIFCLGHSTFRSGYSLNSSAVIAVTIYPGEMVLTRIPNWPHSEARLRASCTTPALEALYAGQMRPCFLVSSSEHLLACGWLGRFARSLDLLLLRSYLRSWRCSLRFHI